MPLAERAFPLSDAQYSYERVLCAYAERASERAYITIFSLSLSHHPLPLFAATPFTEFLPVFNFCRMDGWGRTVLARRSASLRDEDEDEDHDDPEFRDTDSECGQRRRRRRARARR